VQGLPFEVLYSPVSLCLIGLAQLSHLTLKGTKAIIKGSGMFALWCRFSRLFLFSFLFMPSGNVSNAVVNFCLMTYPSGFYSFSLLFFLVRNFLLVSKKIHDFHFGAVRDLLWGQ